ncbi:hypothetical protein [Ktedonosporobacter rubrisoli]|uniref:hypothetical protein n=1 Tax=Ktedonosporobacter rubrisoli TaxID=2509675 RepID=UPI001F5DAA84|nr:hypothetical protein [Ktedonosporobacter rubrisoli]
MPSYDNSRTQGRFLITANSIGMEPKACMGQQPVAEENTEQQHDELDGNQTDARPYLRIGEPPGR